LYICRSVARHVLGEREGGGQRCKKRSTAGGTIFFSEKVGKNQI